MFAKRFSRLLRSPQRAWQFGNPTGTVSRLATRASRWLGMARGSYAWQKTITACGGKLGWTQRNNFLVLGSARSGTTLLVDYLNCHPRVCCRGEILNSDYLFYGNPRNMDHQRLRLHVQSFFVKRPSMLLGAKLLTYQLDELPISLADLLEILYQPRVISLYREQILGQYASFKLAERSGVWHANNRIHNAPIWLDPKIFLAFAERERRMWRENLSMLEGMHVHYLSYEQLTRHPELSMRGVFEYLGLETCDVESFVTQLNPQRLSDKVTNYRQLSASGVLHASALQLPYDRQEIRKAG